MNYRSFARMFTRSRRRQPLKRAVRPRTLRPLETVLGLESLEDRTLLSTSPAGQLQFSVASFSDNAGSTATIVVTRTGGDTGAVSVTYATSNGTGVAGTDYTPYIGTLTWANGDETPKIFSVTLPTNANPTDQLKSVDLSLSNPTGGATLGSQSTSVLSILPDPQAPQPKVVSQQQLDPTNASAKGQDTQPSISANPMNPQEVVSVWTFDNTSVNPTVYQIEGQYSTNGGSSWTAFTLPAALINPAVGPPTAPFPFGEQLDASVAFNRSGDFYVMWKEQATTGTDNVGAIRVARYTFSTVQSGTYTPDTVSTVYEWDGNDNALDPTLTVDTNPATYSDPTTGATQNDLYSGNVYVAFVIQVPPVAVLPPIDFNPYTIWAIGSADEGQSWSNLTLVPNNNDDSNIVELASDERDEQPQIVVSSGTASGSIMPGTVTIAYTNYGPSLDNPATPATGPFSDIKVVTVADPPINETFTDSNGGNINPGIAGATTTQAYSAQPESPINGGNPYGETDSQIAVPQGQFVSVSNITVTVNINYGADGATFGDGDLNIELKGPNGAVVELSDRHGGFQTPGNFNGTTFSDQAGTSIANGSPPYSGTYKPDGVLAGFNGINPSGDWTLEVLDYGAGSGTLVNWTLNVTGATASTAQITTFPIAVDITDPRFSTATGLVVGMAIEESNDKQISAELLPPASSGLAAIQLFVNGENANGSSNQGLGLNGANFGYDNGTIADGVLQDGAESELVGATPFGSSTDGPAGAAPYIGVYIPEYASLYGNTGTLSEVNGQSAAKLDGVWTLVITDYQPESPNNAHQLFNWYVTFVSGMAQMPAEAARIVATDALTGGADGLNSTKIPASPALGVGPSPVLVQDDTLGSFSPYQGRLYLVYANRVITPPVDLNQNPADNTDIYLTYSDNDGQTWSTPEIVNDDSPTDGFSGGDRAQFLPQAAVDPYTGTLAISFYDARYDPARVRVVNTVTVSIDGGQSFSAQDGAYTDPTRSATDAITGLVDSTAIPENDSSEGSGVSDATFGLGEHEGITLVDGHLYNAWITNQNGGTVSTAPLNDRVWESDTEVVAGPRIIDSTMGPVQALSIDGQTFNASTAADGTPELQGFAVTFDRPVSPSSFTANEVHAYYLSAVPGAGEVPVAIGNVTPLDQTALGATTFFVSFATPQTAVGTYSYAVGPDVSDRIRSPLGGQGNDMDQNADGTAGEAGTATSGGDLYAAPTPVNNGPSFQAPYSEQTLPLIIPGPHIVSTYVPGRPASATNTVVNAPVNAIDVVFDRNMQAATFTPSAILRMVGPDGETITGPFTITPNPNGTDPNPNYPRTFQISFPAQSVSGTYTITLAPVVRDENGDLMDTNENAGVDLLFDKPSGGTTNYSQSNTTVTPLPYGNTTSTITVSNPFVLQGVQVGLTINDPNDQTLAATLIAPNGTQVPLFIHVGGNGANFTNTVLSDSATLPTGQPNPITLGAAPFNGTFNPQEPLSVLNGTSANGTWTLEINNNSVSQSGSLAQWSLTFQKPVPLTGLGESVADQYTASFQEFNWSPTSATSQSSWTAIGPASINDNGSAGEVSAMAVDPSDPSGNTVYIGAASGGVWKTTDFMTTAAQGPTWVPLTDTGPANGMNIGSLTIFDRNNDPNQSIILAGTGDVDTGSPGVGMLLSINGGQTWTILDSLNNTVAQSARDNTFVGTQVAKVAIDPTLSPSGQVIMYAAVDGGTTVGGIYKSTNSGQTWTKLGSGLPTGADDPTDLVLQTTATDPTSGAVRLLYAAFGGSTSGVYISSNQGNSWTLMAGNEGNPQLRDATAGNDPQITIAAPTSLPNAGANERIKLAIPDATNSPLENLLYQGWVYAMVVNSTGALAGLYVTKDYGQDWTQIAIPITQPGPVNQPYVVDRAGLPLAPVNNTSNPNYNITSSYGKSDMAIAIDPSNPNLVYLGGLGNINTITNPFSLIRVDTTGIVDGYDLTAFNSFENNGGDLDYQETSGGGVVRQIGTNPTVGVQGSTTNYLNITHNPLDPFDLNSTVQIDNVTQMNNTGAVADWTPIDFISPQTDGQPSYAVHQLMTYVDPITGQTRLIVGNDQGVYSGTLTSNGNEDLGVDVNGLSGAGVADAIGSRNGNLQIAQLLQGAVQPTTASASKNGSLLFAAGYAEGSLSAPTSVLTSGNLNWVGQGVPNVSDNVGVDETGQTAQSYWYLSPGNFDGVPDYYQVGTANPSAANVDGGIVRTTGLALNNNTAATWPNSPTGFAVNPVNASEMVLGSSTGGVFRTDTTGFQWFEIGSSATLTNSAITALTYGAPQPNDPSGAQDDLIYAGTANGELFFTTNGGGSWTNISEGLTGGQVQQIVTDPKHGSYDAYAVTTGGVFYMPNALAANATWQNITGNLFGITYNPFGSPALNQTLLKSLTSILVDWRYAIPNNANQPNGATHPVLYVGGNGGIFRSTTQGTTWTEFPDVTDNGATVNGGYLPVADVTSLSLSDGNINPASGLPVADSNTLNLLMATTNGRGAFAIALPGPAAPTPPSTDQTLSVASYNGTYTLFNVPGNHSLYQYTPTSGWTQIGGAGSIESVSAVANASGGVYAFVMTTDKALYSYHNGWSLIGSPGTISSISAGTDNSGNAVVFAVTNTNALFEFDTAIGWSQLGGSGTIQSVSGTSHDTVVAVLTSNAVYEHNDQYGWFPLAGAGFGQQLSVTTDSTGVVVNAMTTNHALYQYRGSTGWTQIGGAGTIASISSGLDTSNNADVFVITSNNGMSEFDGAKGWQTLGGSGSILKVSAGAADEVFAITADESIFGFSPQFGWFRLSGSGFGQS